MEYYPWSFFAEALNSATNALHEYAFLVKKVRFPVIMLPPVKIVTALVTHLIFLAITGLVLAAHGIAPGAGWLRLPLYLAGLILLVTGLGWITAALHAFSRDVGYIVNVLLQFGFWLTPVFWNPEMIANPYLAALLRLNPLFHLLGAYRACLLPATPYPASGAAWFWMTALLSAGAGAWIFRRLKPHFADVL
ncbi:MAG: ABC transporter permease [Lentisphaerae bacterium]|nr:ABC transporter permease [Lentisphaerota bacterium]